MFSERIRATSTSWKAAIKHGGRWPRGCWEINYDGSFVISKGSGSQAPYPQIRTGLFCSFLKDIYRSKKLYRGFQLPTIIISIFL